MTDPHAPLSDEDLSALLDGEAPPEVARLVEADPRARERLAQLQAASGAVRQAPLPGLDPATVDRLVARALAAQVTGHTGPTGAGPHGAPVGSGFDGSGVVAPLASARRKRSVPAFLVAAVVVALAAIGLTLVWSGVDTSDDDVASNAPDPVAESDAGTAEDQSGAGAGADAPDGEAAPPGDASVGPGTGSAAMRPGETPAELVDLGAFDDTNELREALATEFPDEEPVESVRFSELSVERCAQQVGLVLTQDDPPTHVGQALVDDEPRLVFEFATESASDGQPTTLVTTVDAETCNPLATFER